MTMRADALAVFEAALEAGDADWGEVAFQLAEALRGPPRLPRRISAVQYLINRGGVRDDGGDLRAMGAWRLRPGLVSRRGLSLDHARESLVEAGYLRDSGPNEPSRTTVDDVLELIRDELSGRPRYCDEPPF